MRSQPSHISRERLLAATLLWLVSGALLLLTTLVPLHTSALGWAPALWLIGAPLLMLLIQEPSLPRQLLALYRQRHGAAHRAIWH